MQVENEVLFPDLYMDGEKNPQLSIVPVRICASEVPLYCHDKIVY